MAKIDNDVVCRICLRNSVNKLSLFDFYEEILLADHIKSIAEVEIQKDDGLPDSICPECLLQLNTALDFKRKCELSDKRLRAKQIFNECKNELQEVVKEEPQTDEYETEYLEFEIDNSCDKPSEVKLDIQTQKKSRAKDLKLICDDCQGTFKSKCKLRVHWKKVHLPQRLHCPQCNHKFCSFKALNEHIKPRCVAAAAVRIEREGKKRIFYCKQCPYSCKRRILMNSHIFAHMGEKPYKCDICSQTYTQLGTLNTHKKYKHQGLKLETPCHICGKKMKNPRQMTRHLSSHQIGKFQCNICNKILSYKTSLTFHMQRHNPVKQFSCETCSAMFSSYTALYNHKRHVHIKGDSYYKHKCNICAYKTSRVDLLIKHTSKHNGTNIPCLICGKFLDDAKKFALHQKLHDEMKYECSICNKKYATANGLSGHKRTQHQIYTRQNKAKKKTNEQNQKVIKENSCAEVESN